MRNENESDVMAELINRTGSIISREPVDSQERMFEQDVAEALRRVHKLRLQMQNLSEYRFIEHDKQQRIAKARRVLRPQLLSLETVLEGLV